MVSPVPLSAEQLDVCEAELCAALPDLYPDSAQREIVERIIIPQLRVVVRTTLAPITLPLSPNDIDALCANVDRAIDDHKTLLDTDGLLRPAMSKINDLRQRVRGELVENFKAACRAALAAHKIYDRTALLSRGPDWFRKCNFPPFGTGLDFAHKILGKSVRNYNYEMLEEIAKQLNLPLYSEEQARVYREALAVHNITDHKTLIKVTRGDLRKMTFPPWGGPAALFAAILGEPLRGNLDLRVRQLVADKVGFRKLTLKEEKTAYRAALTQHKIYDRTALLYRGTMWFIRTDFPPFGSARAFTTEVLGKTIPFITSDTLAEIADRLNLPLHSEEQAKVYREALAVNGIIDRERLVRTLSAADLFKMDFPPWGGVAAFFSEILGETVCRITVALRHRIADRVGFRKATPDEEKAVYRAALAVYDIDDRGTLYTTKINDLIKMNFPPFGKGKAFVSIIIGRKDGSLKFYDLVRAADALDLPLVSEKRKQEYRALLSVYHLYDRLALTQIGSRVFTNTEFRSYGKGQAFSGRILGKTVRDVTHKILHELADALGFPPLTPETLRESYRAALAEHGIHDRSTLIQIGTRNFRLAEFTNFGKGAAFASRILGKTVKNLSLVIFNELADALGW